MISAFGIEHGEISKLAVRARGIPRGRRTAAQRRTAGRGGPSGPQKVAGAFNRIGEADISLKGIGASTGRGLGRFGSFVERHPGATGTALVGGAGAGGYKAYTRKDKK